MHKDEGVIKHYLRNSYMAIGMLLGIYAAVTYYHESQKLALVYEDHIDWVVFNSVKRGVSPNTLARVMYYSDPYSVENRAN